MRKYLLGFLFGVLLTFASSVYADEATKIGKKITAEYPVLLDGVELPVTAVAFEGTSYAPIRVLAEVLGLKVDFQDNKVLLTSAGEEMKQSETEIIEEAIKQIDIKIRGIRFDLQPRERELRMYGDLEGTEHLEKAAKEKPAVYGPILEQRKAKYEEVKAKHLTIYPNYLQEGTPPVAWENLPVEG